MSRRGEGRREGEVVERRRMGEREEVGRGAFECEGGKLKGRKDGARSAAR
jgi:hypothetical protein